MVSSPVGAGSEANTTPGRSSNEQEENSRGIEDNRFTIASGKLSLGTNWLRDAASYWSESLIKKRGQAPVQFDAIGFQSRCVIGAVPGAGHACGLRLGGSRGIRLRRLASGGSRCGKRWFLSRYIFAEFQGANTGGLRTNGREVPPSGLKPNSRISAGNLLPSRF